ncbi:hypothetical protein KZZ52_43010 [Dactylosporangium sp. AC04546]|nr:hypothetical protein [Dactylosporangium sp. AC04546]WVK80684.1 hypothetical protein KZZ52_43010 [Dactylosporangium sp. AC04546]
MINTSVNTARWPDEKPTMGGLEVRRMHSESARAARDDAMRLTFSRAASS